MLDGLLHQHLGGLLPFRAVLLAQLVPVLVDGPEQARQGQIHGGQQRGQQQEDAEGPAHRPAAWQTQQHGQQTAQHAAGEMLRALRIEHAEHIQAPDRLGLVNGQMGHGGHQQGEAQGAEHPHDHGLAPVEKQGNGAEHQPDGQDDQADAAPDAHEKASQGAGLVQPAQENDQRQQGADAAPDLPLEMGEDALLPQGLLSGRGLFRTAPLGGFFGGFCILFCCHTYDTPVME